MHIEKEHIYHIYNQGNNQNEIFFERENYLFFLRKISELLLPYTDILAWCLMPNHFHLLLYVHTKTAILKTTNKPCNINLAIGILLRSYTRAIQKQQNITGSLFRQQTKAINLTKIEKITPSWFQSFGVTQINYSIPEKEYPNVCFNYILQNPVKARLVKNISDWEFSSAKDILGLRNGKLINKDKINELGLKING